MSDSKFDVEHLSFTDFDSEGHGGCSAKFDLSHKETKEFIIDFLTNKMKTEKVQISEIEDDSDEKCIQFFIKFKESKKCSTSFLIRTTDLQQYKDLMSKLKKADVEQLSFYDLGSGGGGTNAEFNLSHQEAEDFILDYIKIKIKNENNKVQVSEINFDTSLEHKSVKLNIKFTEEIYVNFIIKLTDVADLVKYETLPSKLKKNLLL